MGVTGNMLGTGSIFRNITCVPKCKIFNCTRSRYVNDRCCYYCQKKGICGDPCLNNPERCGMCFYPEPKEGEEKVWELGSDRLPDEPGIQKMERFGTTTPGEEEEIDVVCPICGKLAERFFYDCDGTLFGCDACVKSIDASDYEPEGGDDI